MENWLAAAAAGVLALFGTSTGEHSRPPMPGSHPPAFEMNKKNASSTLSQIDIQCVAAAVAAREATLDSAIATHTQEINTAYTTRALALASAYTQSSAEAIRKAVKDAGKQFMTAMKNSKKTWQKAREAAWKQFKTARQACGGGAASISDESTQGQELNE